MSYASDMAFVMALVAVALILNSLLMSRQLLMDLGYYPSTGLLHAVEAPDPSMLLSRLGCSISSREARFSAVVGSIRCCMEGFNVSC